MERFEPVGLYWLKSNSLQSYALEMQMSQFLEMVNNFSLKLIWTESGV